MPDQNQNLPVKPARSFEEQFHRLRSVHGLEISNVDRARHVFSKVNYYRLTTYGKHLRSKEDPERFAPGVSLDTLYALYEFDMGLRHALWPVLEFFEIQLRAKLSYRLAMRYGSLGYLNEANFFDSKQARGTHKSLLHKFSREIEYQDDSPIVRHHNKTYGGKYPIWVAVEFFTFGMLGQLFDIMTNDDQSAICEDYDLTPKQLTELIDAAVNARNICAHYSRLYNQPLEDQPILSGQDARYEGHLLFPLVLALRSVAGNERVYWNMVRAIAQLQNEFPEADLALCGFPADWEDVLRGKD